LGLVHGPVLSHNEKLRAPSVWPRWFSGSESPVP
jgi:hypothetical protein